MTQPIDISRAGMLRQQQFVDITANNVANVDTPGFKVSRPVLESGEAVPASGGDLPALSGTMQIGRLFTQGALHQTGVSTDLAVDGAGFFVVRGADGNDVYTRDGSFQLDANGTLVDAAGRTLQPPITVPPGSGALEIGADGAVSLRGVTGQSQALGQLQLAVFPNPGGLVAGGDGTFSATAASGTPVLSAAGQGGAGAVRQGALEGANADLAEQMSSLIAAQRAYQLNTQAFRIEDELLQMTNQLQTGG